MKIEEKYPKNFQGFLIQFPDEKFCWQYLIDIRWANGYVCSQCNSVNTSPITYEDITNKN